MTIDLTGKTIADSNIQSPDTTLSQEPPDYSGLERNLIRDNAPNMDISNHPELEDVREDIKQKLEEYVDTPNPKYMLLVVAAPGTGKTWAGVHLAHWAQQEKKMRVMYIGPRHDFFQDILNISPNPSQWYEWQPRQLEDENGNGETCRYTPHINEWMKRGYDGFDFCKKVCGFDYMKRCPYLCQKNRREPIVYCQHQHIALGHPMAGSFNLIIGDENPSSAFLRPWNIPNEGIMPQGMDPTEPLAEMLYIMGMAHRNKKRRLEGPKLIEYLGGPDKVLAACKLFTMPSTAKIWTPNLQEAKDAENVPYFHLPELKGLLEREAQWVKNGKPYPPRIALNKHGLTLYLRHNVDEQLAGKHTIWFDATGNEHIYASLFGGEDENGNWRDKDVHVINARPKLRGKIYQIWERANGISDVLTHHQEKGKKAKRVPNAKSDQLVAQVNAIARKKPYKNVAVITYMGLEPRFTEKYKTLHFFASRGTNELEDVDCLVVAGTPLPPPPQMEVMARMLYFRRMEPFQDVWYTQDMFYPYIKDGHGWKYPIGGFWNDPDLKALLWQYREAEIIQSAHRARPINRQTDIYLLTNIPIIELPLTGLWSLRDVMGVPEKVPIWRWHIVDFWAELAVEGEKITRQDLKREFGYGRDRADNCMEALVNLGCRNGHRWIWDVNKGGGKGRPEKCITKVKCSN